MKDSTHFPAPDPAALARSNALSGLIRDEIGREGGWISFARYMELALYTPELGYYANPCEKFGREGDFVTAPEMTPLFACALARQIREIMAAGVSTILECGAGSGRLARDLLRALAAADSLPEYYRIVEISAGLRARQRATLSDPVLPADALDWLDSLPEDFSGLVLANELLDALPVHLVCWQSAAICERGVATGREGQFCFVERPADGALLEQARTIAEEVHLLPDYRGEVALAAMAWITDWGKRLRSGTLLLIDYGYSRRELYHPQRHFGTLRCHYRHQAHDDPFLLPGLQDITAHVDFTGVALAAQAAGLDLHGYTSQSNFLLNCGLLDDLARLGPPETAQYRQAASAVHRLLLPQCMGESFKVLALGRGLAGEWCGFAQGDRGFSL